MKKNTKKNLFIFAGSLLLINGIAVSSDIIEKTTQIFAQDDNPGDDEIIPDAEQLKLIKDAESVLKELEEAKQRGDKEDAEYIITDEDAPKLNGIMAISNEYKAIKSKLIARYNAILAWLEKPLIEDPNASKEGNEEKRFVTITREIMFKTIEKEDPNLEVDKTREEGGVVGLLEVTYQAIFRDGVEDMSTRDEIGEVVKKEPVDKIIYKGTKQPAKPEQPAEPEKPTEPAKPEKQTEPKKPEQPAEPEQPTEPAKPEQPVEPEKPTEPAKPEQPAEPEKPTEPEKPEQPTEPEKPTEPTKPEQPAEPEKPEQPTEQEKPTEPAKPEKPAEPEQPTEPTKPEQPAKPEQPEQPTEPEKPTKPGQSAKGDQNKNGAANIQEALEEGKVPEKSMNNKLNMKISEDKSLNKKTVLPKTSVAKNNAFALTMLSVVFVGLLTILRKKSR